MSDGVSSGGITLNKTPSVPLGTYCETDQSVGDYNALTVISSMSGRGSLFWESVERASQLEGRKILRRR